LDNLLWRKEIYFLLLEAESIASRVSISFPLHHNMGEGITPWESIIPAQVSNLIPGVPLSWHHLPLTTTQRSHLKYHQHTYIHMNLKIKSPTHKLEGTHSNHRTQLSTSTPPPIQLTWDPWESWESSHSQIVHKWNAFCFNLLRFRVVY
jgi:hypothetical protein